MSTQITATGGEGEPRRNTTGGGFFSLYKPGQGYWTRLGTALGAAAVILFIGWFIFDETRVFPALVGSSRRYAVAAAVVALLALVAWWLINTPKRAQFIIDTDSEMKKVNWASWPELVGSTKVVVFFMLLTAIILFIFDVQFNALFHSIGVWHTFNAPAGIATGVVVAVLMIIVGIALIRGPGDGTKHKTSGSITAAIGAATLIAWLYVAFTMTPATAG